MNAEPSLHGLVPEMRLGLDETSGSSVRYVPPAIAVGAATDRGPRPHNEDWVYVDPRLGVGVVADGVGGGPAGASASRVAAETAVKILGGDDVSRSSLQPRLSSLVEEVNRAVRERARRDPSLEGMGTTLVLALIRGTRYHVANVGDSRAYLLRGGTVTQLSTDHSLVQERVRAGLITPEEAESQPDKNVITRAIGPEEEVEPNIVSGPVQSGDLFVLTSDGVHGVLSPTTIGDTARAGTPEESARELVRMALEAGTRDNATAAVLAIGAIGKAAEGEDTEGTELEQILGFQTPPETSTMEPARKRRYGWFAGGVVLLLLALFLAVTTLL